jgi:hypothetical protein
VFCSFLALALVLKKAVEDRIAAFSRSGSWPKIIADLNSLTETEIEPGRQALHCALRSTPRRQPRYSCGRRCAAAHRARRLSLIPATEMYGLSGPAVHT